MRHLFPIDGNRNKTLDKANHLEFCYKQQNKYDWRDLEDAEMCLLTIL